MKPEINFVNLNKDYKKFLIDTSSLIYLHKADIFKYLLKSYKIIIIDEIKREIEKKENILNYYKSENLIFHKKSISLSENMDITETMDINNNENRHSISINLLSHIDSLKKISVNDLILVKTALINNMPLITEDRKIMEVCEKINISYFNSLIIVYFLVKNGTYNKKDGIKKLFLLSNIGWYKDVIFRLVFNLIDKL